jgi:nitrogen regulatory protein PII
MDRRRADPGAEPGGGDLTPDARSAVRIELVVPDEQVARVRDAIAECPHGPFRSPGRILISAVDEVVELGSQRAETAATHLPARP